MSNDTLKLETARIMEKYVDPLVEKLKEAREEQKAKLSRQAQAIDRAIDLWEHAPFFLIVRGDSDHVSTLTSMRDELRKQLEGMR